MDINITIILFFIVLTEAITELLVKSEFFYPLRKFLFNRSSNKIFKFLHNLLDCGYCTSVWVAYILLLVYYLKGLNWLLFLSPLIIHRLANLFHFIIDKIDETK